MKLLDKWLSNEEHLYILTREITVGTCLLFPMRRTEIRFLNGQSTIIQRGLGNSATIRVDAEDGDKVLCRILGGKPLPSFWVKRRDLVMRDLEDILFLKLFWGVPKALYRALKAKVTRVRA